MGGEGGGQGDSEGGTNGQGLFIRGIRMCLEDSQSIIINWFIWI